MSQEIVLVTGGAGFIGTNFVYHICNKYPAYKVVVIDKLTYAGNLDNIQPLIDAGKIDFVQADISDEAAINNLFSRYSFTKVVNFAAETHVDRSIKEPAQFVQTNIVGTHTLLAACREFKVPRFHHVSTDEVYGDLGDGSTNFFTETTPLAPNCPYAAAKASSDLLVRAYFETYRMHVTTSRCSNNYGPYQFPEKLIPFMFNLANHDKPLPMYGDGKNIRDWLYVEDHCEAIDLILHNAAAGEIYNIGGHNEKQNIEIATLILEFLGKPTTLITYVEDRKAHDRRYAIDPAKIGAELGWKPKTMFKEGIKKTFDWYTANTQWSDRVIEKNSATTQAATPSVDHRKQGGLTKKHIESNIVSH